MTICGPTVNGVHRARRAAKVRKRAHIARPVRPPVAMRAAPRNSGWPCVFALQSVVRTTLFLALPVCHKTLREGKAMKVVLFRAWILFFGMAALGTSASFAQSGWFWQNPLPQGNSLLAAAAPNASTVVAAGEDGTILRTDDAGATWTRQSSGTTNILSGVSFVDADTGTAVGASGTILRTDDGGAIWRPQSSGRTNLFSGSPSSTPTPGPQWAPLEPY